jgi:MoaA/NifB/PqqE/SkfB family radical SAM enzyme
MYNLEEIKVIHLEPTRRCQAKCPMCRRRIQGGKLNPYPDLTDEISLEDFKKWIPENFVRQLKRLYMCGNLGDPIIAEDTLEIFKYLRGNNPSIGLMMRTNGSARNEEWWKSIARLNVRVVFALDGLKDTHSLYRVNTDWDKIINNAKAFISSGGRAEWAMIIFKHNEHQVEECRRISQELGFEIFTPKHTSRFKDDKFDVLDETGDFAYSLYPTSYSETIRDTITEARSLDSKQSPRINCRVQENKSLFISANGKVTPCCWTAMDSRNPSDRELTEYQNRIQDPMSLHSFSLKEIFDTQFAQKIKDTWTNSPLSICSKQCGRVVPCEVQLIEKNKLPNLNE